MSEEALAIDRPRGLSTRGVALRGNPWLTLVSVALGVVMVGLDASVVAIANPRIASDLGASLSDLQWITNAYLLALAVLLLVGGKLGDRYGRRAVFLIGVVGFAAASVGIGLVGTTDGVIALRVLQGVFGALLMPNTLAILRSTFPAEKLNLAIGIWAGASAVSVAAGPIIGGLLVEHVGWQSVFYINAPIGVLAVLTGLVVLKESRNQSSHHGLEPGTAVFCASLFAIVFGLIKAQAWGWVSVETIAFILGGLALLGCFVAIELRARQPMLPMRLFANRSLSIGTAVVATNFFAMFGVLFFFTLYLENVHDLTPVASGVRLLPLTLTLMVAAPLGGWLTQKLGPRPPMITGLLGVSVALFLLTSLEPHSGFDALWPPFILLGAGLGLVLTSSSDAIIGNATVDDAGIAGGLQSTALQLGAVMGTAILGSVLTSRVGSVLAGKLTATGTPTAIVAKLRATQEIVAQGIAPTITGIPAPVQAAITEGTHNAFIAGLHTSMTVAAIAVLLAAIPALLVTRGENSATTVSIGH
jgi:EmrB/QacA subfamily drug resistance transporter